MHDHSAALAEKEGLTATMHAAAVALANLLAERGCRRPIFSPHYGPAVWDPDFGGQTQHYHWALLAMADNATCTALGRGWLSVLAIETKYSVNIRTVELWTTILLVVSDAEVEVDTRGLTGMGHYM